MPDELPLQRVRAYRVGWRGDQAVVAPVRPQPEPGQLGRGQALGAVAQQPPQQVRPGRRAGAEQVPFGGPVPVDHCPLHRRGVAADGEQPLQQHLVRDAGGPAVPDHQLHRAVPSGLHPAQQPGHRDALRGPVRAQPPGLGEVPSGRVLVAFQRAEATGQQQDDLAAYLVGGQPGHLGGVHAGRARHLVDGGRVGGQVAQQRAERGDVPGPGHAASRCRRGTTRSRGRWRPVPSPGGRPVALLVVTAR